jgi:hypothetical protein
MLLAQGTRSIQCALNDLLPKLGLNYLTVSKVAYSKARHKLLHGAFIELNQKAVVRTMYENGDYETFKGHRILATDGSKFILPENDELTIKEFGTLPYDNGQGSSGEHCYGLASTLYDVRNRVALDSTLAPCKSYEVDLAIEHLKHTAKNDLVIYDRGYASYRMMAEVNKANVDFLIRIPSGRFKKVTAEMFRGEGSDDVTITLHAPKKLLKNPKNQGLPKTLNVRFVRVVLDNGEIEVLATSLLDTKKFTTANLKELYWMRWGAETFYGILKTRLDIENFTGYSPEAIKQDFYATVFLTGAETILTEDAEEYLSKQTGGHPKKVNKAVSFNAIRDQAFEIFYSRKSDKKRLKALTELFLTSPTIIRKGRNPKRSTTSALQRLNFRKRKWKIAS